MRTETWVMFLFLDCYRFAIRKHPIGAPFSLASAKSAAPRMRTETWIYVPIRRLLLSAIRKHPIGVPFPLAPAKSAAPRSQRKRGSCSCCSCLQFKNIQSMFHFLWLQPNLQHLAPVLLPPSLALPLKKNDVLRFFRQISGEKEYH